jgi:hypothetical protein
MNVQGDYPCACSTGKASRKGNQLQRDPAVAIDAGKEISATSKNRLKKRPGRTGNRRLYRVSRRGSRFRENGMTPNGEKPATETISQPASELSSFGGALEFKASNPGPAKMSTFGTL